MIVAVHGGLGLQGRAAIADLAASPGVETVVCVDTAPGGFDRLAGLVDPDRVRLVVPEGPMGAALAGVMRDVDVAIDLMPLPLMRDAVTVSNCRAARRYSTRSMPGSRPHSVITPMPAASAAGPRSSIDPA